MHISELLAAGVHGVNSFGRRIQQSRFRKHQQKRQPDLAIKYAGKWRFHDTKTQHTHVMEIGQDFSIKIDHRLLPGRLIKLDENELIFLDHYGFQLKVYADYICPVEIYDEASDQTYPILNHTDAPIDEPDPTPHE